MIVPEKINYFYAIRVTGTKFFILAFSTFLISHWISINGWNNELIPDRFIIITSSALGIFLGFRINAAYSRWRDGHGVFRDLIAACMSVMAQITLLTKSKPDCVDDLYDFKLELAALLLQYAHLVRLELLEVEPANWRTTLTALTFNKKPLFSEQEISKLITKKRKASYVIRQLSDLIHNRNSAGTPLFITTGDIAKSVQLLYLLEQTMVSLKYTPFPWGYQFYTRLFVWMLPVLLIFSSFNQLTLTDNLMISFISTVFITIEQVSRNLDEPISESFNGVPFNALCRTLDIGLLEFLDIEHDLKFLKAKHGVLS